MTKKYTLCLTHQCNFRCAYCYIDKRSGRMPIEVAERIVESIFASSSGGEEIDIGFFGGEPLLEFDLLTKIVGLIETHPGYERNAVTLSVVTNGTVFSEDVAAFLGEHGIVLCVSCDGTPQVQDRFRKFRNGRASSAKVLKTIGTALKRLPLVLVNAVYRPETLDDLPESVVFLSALGVRQIYLNPDVTAPWREEDAARLSRTFGSIGDFYVRTHLDNDPHFISLIDGKIAVLLRGGYQRSERCQMGSREIAFSAEGSIYPCERLIGDGRGGPHCIGNIQEGLTPSREGRFCTDPAATAHTACSGCGIREYCMNWCGCSNFLSTGHYDRMSPFLCASERAAVETALRVYERLESIRPGIFSDHLAGKPSMLSRVERRERRPREQVSSSSACIGC